MKKILAIFLLIPFLGFSQEEFADFPRDTSFNVNSAARKIANDFPHAVVVKEFENEKVQDERDVVYYTLGNRRLHADLFYPKGKCKTKIAAVVLIHGGGWASGDKSHLVPLAQKLAENGFFAASVEHRLSPEAIYPAAIIDLKTFVKWLKINAGEYNIDTAKVAVLGSSAGATLASFLGTTGQSSKFKSHEIAEKVSDNVQAIVNIDGVLDFTDTGDSPHNNNIENPSAGTRWFGCTYHQNQARWAEASPLMHVSGNTPPTIFINSALPRFHAGRDEFIQVLSQNDIYSEVHTIENTPHPFWLFHPWFDETVPFIVNFLNRVF